MPLPAPALPHSLLPHSALPYSTLLHTTLTPLHLSPTSSPPLSPPHSSPCSAAWPDHHPTSGKSLGHSSGGIVNFARACAEFNTGSAPATPTPTPTAAAGSASATPTPTAAAGSTPIWSSGRSRTRSGGGVRDGGSGCPQYSTSASKAKAYHQLLLTSAASYDAH